MSEERRYIPDLVVYGARIIYRNFEGREVKLPDGRVINEKGNRNVCLIIPPDILDNVREVGWNIKPKKKKSEDEEDLFYLPIKANYHKSDDGNRVFGPIASLITSRGQTRLTEETIGQLDWARIKNVDICVRGKFWPPSRISPEGCVAAYLKSIYVTIQEDALEEKYANIPFVDGNVDDEEMPFDE